MLVQVATLAHALHTYPPLPPSLPACCHVLRYGLETARGIAGGLVGEKDDCAKTVDASRVRDARDNILSQCDDDNNAK